MRLPPHRCVCCLPPLLPPPRVIARSASQHTITHLASVSARTRSTMPTSPEPELDDGGALSGRSRVGGPEKMGDGARDGRRDAAAPLPMGEGARKPSISSFVLLAGRCRAALSAGQRFLPQRGETRARRQTQPSAQSWCLYAPVGDVGQSMMFDAGRLVIVDGFFVRALRFCWSREFLCDGRLIKPSAGGRAGASFLRVVVVVLCFIDPLAAGAVTR